MENKVFCNSLFELYKDIPNNKVNVFDLAFNVNKSVEEVKNLLLSFQCSHKFVTMWNNKRDCELSLDTMRLLFSRNVNRNTLFGTNFNSDVPVLIVNCYKDGTLDNEDEFTSYVKFLFSDLKKVSSLIHEMCHVYQWYIYGESFCKSSILTIENYYERFIEIEAYLIQAICLSNNFEITFDELKEKIFKDKLGNWCDIPKIFDANIELIQKLMENDSLVEKVSVMDKLKFTKPVELYPIVDAKNKEVLTEGVNISDGSSNIQFKIELQELYKQYLVSESVQEDILVEKLREELKNSSDNK